MKDMFNTLMSVIRTAKETGDVLASEELKDKRMKICNMCEHYAEPKCQVCGCFMAAKSALVAANCPKGRWDEKLVEEAMFGEMSQGFENEHCCKS